MMLELNHPTIQCVIELSHPYGSNSFSLITPF